MKTLIKKSLVTILASCLVAGVSSAALAHGRHGGGHEGSGSSGTGGGTFSGGQGFGEHSRGNRLMANLVNTTGTSDGRIEYRQGTSHGNIKIGVTLPIGGTTPLLADLTTASTAALVVSFTNATTGNYAACTLAITDIFWQYTQGSTSSSQSANYQARVSSVTDSSATTTVTATVGTCLNTGSTNTADLPTVTSKDTVSVTLNGGTTPILTGTFQ